MSLPIAIALNVALCLALVAALAWMMTRPRKLRPHVPARTGRLTLIEEQVIIDEQQERRAA